jgi:light-regulated signal transduction histidine kinase (bacteriophytochrome)
VLLSGVMLVFYQSEIKKHQMQQAQIIENLQFNNRQIEMIKKEIEQYVFIITNRLKIQLESVNQTFIAINEHTESKDYTALEQRLNIGISNSKQMYFWVNKVLEKTRFIETITAQYQEVNLNEVLENVKHSLVQTHLGINRIHSTDLPNVFVNESDIFIVVYSLCDVFLLDSSNSTIEITSISNDEYVEVIFQNESSNLIMNEYANSGLSLCQILVNNWHGWMSMDVMREKGNKISILIPANSRFAEIQNRNKKTEYLK